MRNTLNNAECLRLIKAAPITVPKTNAKHTFFLSKEEREQHIRALYEKWQQIQK